MTRKCGQWLPPTDKRSWSAQNVSKGSWNFPLLREAATGAGEEKAPSNLS